MEAEFWIFALFLLNSILLQKMGKSSHFWSFLPFFQKVMNARSWNLVYELIGTGYKYMWNIGQVRYIFGPLVAPEKVKISHFSSFLPMYQLFIITTAWNSVCKLFEAVYNHMQNFGHVGQFFGPLVAQKIVKISHFSS